MDEVAKFQETLKRLLKEREVSLTALSKATGIPASTLSEWSGGREPKLGEPIVRLARFFGVSIEYLVTGKSTPERVISDLVEGLESTFATVHQGTYRITVEKQLGRESRTNSNRRNDDD